MNFEELKKYLEEEKIKLFKAKDYITSYYNQVVTSLESIRDNLFPYSFTSKQMWKNEINKKATHITVPDIIPEKIAGDPEFNSNTLIAIINNIYAIQNSYMTDPSIIEISEITIINKAHNFLLSFLRKQYTKANMSTLKRKQLELAYLIKNTIEERINNNITPFFQRVELIKSDEYIIKLYSPFKEIVGNFNNYKSDNAKYDKLFEKKSIEIGLKNNLELNLKIIADLAKKESLVIKEIMAKYKSQSNEKNISKSYRLKEIIFRYTSQADNIFKLGDFLSEVLNIVQDIPLLKRLFNAILHFITGKDRYSQKRDLIFFYSNTRGKILRRQASLKQVIKDIYIYHEIILKAKQSIDFDIHTKVTNNYSLAEIEMIIDISYDSLNNIIEKSNGFREWLAKERNKKILKRISEKKQTDFSDILLTINRVRIVNIYNLMEFEKYKKRD